MKSVLIFLLTFSPLFSQTVTETLHFTLKQAKTLNLLLPKHPVIIHTSQYDYESNLCSPDYRPHGYTNTKGIFLSPETVKDLSSASPSSYWHAYYTVIHETLHCCGTWSTDTQSPVEEAVTEIISDHLTHKFLSHFKHFSPQQLTYIDNHPTSSAPYKSYLAALARSRKLHLLQFCIQIKNKSDSERLTYIKGK